ncbi:hypothetical protein A6B36_12165 [Lactiplantibacillus plantarum]|nr:hypothetical protein A6B36_12165 [Lactiplantibacillus plantarum]
MSSYSNELLMLIFQSTLCKQVLIFFAYSGLYYLVTYFMDKKIQYQKQFLLKLGLVKLKKRNKTRWEKIRLIMQLFLIVSILVLVVSTFVLNPDDQYILLVIYVMKLATFTSFAIAFVDSLGPIKEIQQLIVGAQSSDTLDSDKKVLTVTIFKKIRWMLILYQVLKVPALIILLNLSVDY